MKIRLATRGSDLALKQAEMVSEYLSGKIEGAEFEIVVVKTSGDKNQTVPLESSGGIGLFTKEIQESVISGDADLAVHSAKDLPALSQTNLVLCATLPRDYCADVLAIREGVNVPSLIASGSPRRRTQLKKMLPSAVWTEIRGNVPNRLKKITSGLADATVLSEAGIKRLNLEPFEGIVFKRIKPEICVPAVGQGIIALECRASDSELYAPFSHRPTHDALCLEKEFLKTLQGGCQTACGAYYDGEVFSFFHENTGIQNIKFAQNSTLEEKLKLVRELAEGAR